MIGIFDSGVGGLSVAKEFSSFIYFADSKNLPYGDKSPEELLQLTRQALLFLVNKGASSLIVACHTASIYSTSLAAEFSIPILFISDLCKKFLETQKHRKILIIGTNRTITSQFYQNIGNWDGIACPSFVSIIENTVSDPETRENAIIDALPPLHNYDALFLACTHFPFLIPEIKKIFPSIEIIDPSQYCIPPVQVPAEGRQFYTSGNKEKFDRTASKLLSSKIHSRKVTEYGAQKTNSPH